MRKFAQIKQSMEAALHAGLRAHVDSTYADIRYARRSLARSPGFTVIVIATLALGIGVNLTMFSLMRAVLWRPLPYPAPNRIVTIRVDARNVANTGATRRELLSLEERSRCLEAVSTMDEVDADLDMRAEVSIFRRRAFPTTFSACSARVLCSDGCSIHGGTAASNNHRRF